MVYLKNCSVAEFENMLAAGIQVVSFGAGKALVSLCKKYCKLENQLVYAADNFARGEVKLENSRITIRPIDECKRMENTIYVISSFKYSLQIIKQLDQINSYDGMEIYVPALFSVPFADVDGDLISIRPGADLLIPPKIHYCWFGHGELPSQFQKNIETWKKYCPDYEIICWNEENYDINQNLYMRQAYEAKRWGFVPDYARLDIINRYGGIYLDTDVELLRPLDDLLQFKLFVGFESPDYIALGLGFGSQKNNIILQDMMQVYNEIQFISSDSTLNLTPSPIYQTQVMEKYGLKRNGKTQVTPQFTALSSEYLCPINSCGLGRPTERSFSIHQYAATWFDDNQKAEKENMINTYRYLLKRLL